MQAFASWFGVRFIGLLLLSLPVWSHAGLLDGISAGDAAGAVRLALEKGSETAVARLGQPGGFSNNPKLKIPLPDVIQKSQGLLKIMGRGDEVAALESAINQAAERAVPEGKAVLLETVRTMTVQDAKAILTGGEDSVTRFFQERSRDDLLARLRPIVDGQISQLGIAQQYDALAGQGQKFGLVKSEDANLSSYVTRRALDGLFAVIAAEEKALRADPIGTGSRLLGKVFGALR